MPGVRGIPQETGRSTTFCKLEIFLAAEFDWVDAARFPVKLEEADDRADADAALHCSAASGMVVPPSIVPTTGLRTSSEYSLRASFQQTA